MTPPSTTLYSFAEIDLYALDPAVVPLHPPPPRLPEGVAAYGGRQAVTPDPLLSIPAFVEDLLLIKLRPLDRLSVKLDRWVHVKIAPGDLVLVPRGRPSAWAVEGAEALIVSLPPALTRKTVLQEAGRDPPNLEFAPRVGHADPFVYAMGNAILGELQTGGLLGMLYLETLFRALVIHLLRHHAVFAAAPPPVSGRLPAAALRRVREYVQEHLEEEITLEVLAALVHLSPYHFSRQFKEATGLPPYQYVLQRRVEQARVLLLAGEHTISAVAHRVGFASQSHLTRHIKNVFGVTPGALLAASKNGQMVRENIVGGNAAYPDALGRAMEQKLV